MSSGATNMTQEQKKRMRDQARILAMDSKNSDPNVVKVCWFPDENEVHIIEINTNTPATLSGSVEPFYFGPVPEEGITVPSGIAVIKPEEFGNLALPSDWGTWNDCEELDIEA
jgi:hypothetical protein